MGEAKGDRTICNGVWVKALLGQWNVTTYQRLGVCRSSTDEPIFARWWCEQRSQVIYGIRCFSPECVGRSLPVARLRLEMVVHGTFDATPELFTTFCDTEDPRLERKDRFERFRMQEGKPQCNDATGASTENYDVAQIEDL